MDFPEGVVTQWFPRVSAAGPSLVADATKSEQQQESFIAWNRVQVLSPEESAEKRSQLPPTRWPRSSSKLDEARQHDIRLVPLTVFEGASGPPEYAFQTLTIRDNTPMSGADLRFMQLSVLEP